MLYLTSIVLFTLGLGAGLCWLFFVINKENQALNASIDKLQAEVDALFNQSQSAVHNVGDTVKDGANIKTYMGNNGWYKTLLHESSENVAVGSCALQQINEVSGNTVIGSMPDEDELTDCMERWRSLGACVDKEEWLKSLEQNPEPEDRP